MERRGLIQRPHYLKAPQLNEGTAVPFVRSEPQRHSTERKGSSDPHCNYKCHIQKQDKSTSRTPSPRWVRTANRETCLEATTNRMTPSFVAGKLPSGESGAEAQLMEGESFARILPPASHCCLPHNWACAHGPAEWLLEHNGARHTVPNAAPHCSPPLSFQLSCSVRHAATHRTRTR